MHTEKRTGQDRRGHSREQLAGLVSSRTETLALYSDLANRRPFAVDHGTERVLQRFCQALIDYTASAHFQLYRHLAENCERRQSVLSVAASVYPRIVETTDDILAFNDKYETAALTEGVAGLSDDLSRLGELLADRIQLEDKIIAVLTSEDRRGSRSAAAN